MGIFHFFVREAFPVILFARFETFVAVSSRPYNSKFVSAAKNIITVKLLEDYPIDVRAIGQ